MRTPRRLALLLLIAGSVYALLSKANEQVQRQDVDQLCGQLQSETPEKKTIVIGGRTESRLYAAYLRGAIITLYPAANAEKECCATGAVAAAVSRKDGAFEFKGIRPGYYWLRVQKKEATRVIPVHLTSVFSEKLCSDSSVRRTFVVDATPPLIEIRIR